MQRKNKHVILLSGFRRGGTNILWNILQSHPKVCSPILETGQVFNKSLKLRFVTRMRKWFSDEKIASLIDSELFKFKLKTLSHDDNRFKHPEQIYTEEEIKQSWLCLKSVDEDIELTDQLLKAYPGLQLILLTRNGYALAESFKRRGKEFDETALHYKYIASAFKKYSNKVEKSKLIKFEDVVQDPFSVSKELFEFLNLDPSELEYLRFKSKKTVDKEGKHNVSFGRENKKYWTSKDTVNDFIVQDVNQNQLKGINEKQMEIFNNIAAEILRDFGYKVL